MVEIICVKLGIFTYPFVTRLNQVINEHLRMIHKDRLEYRIIRNHILKEVCIVKINLSIKIINLF